MTPRPSSQQPHRPAPSARSAWRRAVAASLLALGMLPAAAQDGPQARLPIIQLSAGMHLIRAEVARSLDEQRVGLMGRKAMGTNEGMLFVYDAPQPHCFWMRNTLLPLTIAFVADDGRIVNLRDMQPLNDSPHCADEPVRFALEMNQGWFAKRGLKAGFKLAGAVFAPAAKR